MRFEIHGTLSLPGQVGVPVEAEIVYTDRCSIKVNAKCANFEPTAPGCTLELAGKDIITGRTLQPLMFRADSRTNQIFNRPDARTVTVFNGTAAQARIGSHDPRSSSLLRFYLGPMPSDWVGVSATQITLLGRTYRIVPFNQGVISHRLEVADIPPTQIPACAQAVEDACFLFKAAFERAVTLAQVEVLQNGVIVEWTLNGVSDVFVADYGPIPEPEVVRFVEHGLPYVQSQEQVFPLRELMDIMQLFQRSEYLELQALLLANFLEVVRYHHAKSQPAVFLERDDIFYLIDPKERRASFKSILQHFCKEYGISGFSQDFVDLRNGVIHQGRVSTGPGADELDRIIALKRFCDTVLLALLEWDKVDGKRTYYAAPTRDEARFVR